MPLINTAVPNLIQGVSQQSDATRFAGQCEEQENALSSVADGLKKRPNTRHISRLLEEAISSDSFIHFINRDDNEKYVVIHDGTKIRTFNLSNGNEGSINDSTGGYTPSASDYLFSTNPRADLRAMTVGDSTIIVNTTKTVSESQGITAGYQPNLAGLFVKQGDYSKEYTINIGDSFFPALTANTETTGSFGTDTLQTIELFGAAPNQPIISPVNLTNVTANFLHTTDPEYINLSNPERVTGFNLDDNRIGYWNSSRPVKIFLRYEWDDIYYDTEVNPITFDPYYDVTDGFDIVYDDNVNTIKSITAKPLTDPSAFLQYMDSYVYEAMRLDGQYSPNVREYVIFDASNISAPAGDLKRAIVSSASADFVGGSSTSIIAGQLVEGGSGRHTSDTYGEGNQEGNFAFRSYEDNGDTIELSDDTRSSTFFLENTAGKPFSISVSDGLGGSGLGLFYEEIDALSSLPLECKKDYAIKIIGDAELNQDDYYVKFQTKSTQEFGNGAWVETAGFYQSTGLDNSTMPHRIINSAVDTFTVESINYADREAGDNDTNPHPSFVGNNIKNLFLYKDRLGFVSNENVIMSGSGDLFNFYRKTVTTLLDDAPIDVSVASGRVLNLSSAVGFQENLILFGDNGQFALKGGDILTPRTVSVNPITNFSLEDQVAPLPLGSYIYFPFTRGAFTGMREFTVNASTDNYDASEVTEHVPAYVPKNIVDMAGTTSEDIIALLSGDEKGSLYIYNYFWNNNQKVLSAWSKFSFVGEIRGIEFIDSTLYAVITNNGETNLVEMPLESGLKDAAGYVTHLDMRVATTVDGMPLASKATSAWSIGTDDTALTTYSNGADLRVRGVGNIATLTIPPTQTKITGTFYANINYVGNVAQDNKLEIKDAGGNVLFTHTINSVQNSFSYTPTGSEVASSLCIYRSYDATGNTPVEGHVTAINNINIVAEYVDATTSTNDTITLPYTPADNSVEVYTTDGLKLNATNSGATVTLSQAVTADTNVFVGIPYTMKYTFSEQLFKAKAGQGSSPSNAAKLMVRNGSIYFDKTAFFKVKVTPKHRDTVENVFTPDIVGSSTLGSLDLDSGFYRFPVFTKAQDTTITIENESALPSNFQSAEFESFIHSRSNRYG